MVSVLRCSTTFEADSSRKKKREREKLRFKISLCPTIRGGLTFSHCAIPMHTHTIRPHYVIRAERYFDLDRSMILWRDCALFACDCINDTCKKRRRKKRKKKKKHSHPPVLVRGIPLAGRCVSNIVTTVADLHFVNIKKKRKKENYYPIRKSFKGWYNVFSRHLFPVYHATRLVYPRHDPRVLPCKRDSPPFFLFSFIIPEIGIVTSERFLLRLFKLRVISGPRTKWKCVETKIKREGKEEEEAMEQGWRRCW